MTPQTPLAGQMTPLGQARGGGAAWTPDSPTPSGGYSPLLWVRSDAGLYQDVAKTTPATSNNDPVGAWADQSGNGNDETQATADKRPTLQLNIINALPVVRFDGSDDFLQQLTLSATQPFSVFVVFDTLTWGADRIIFDGYSLQAYLLQRTTANQYGYTAGALLETGVEDAGFILVEVLVNGASSAIYVDSVLRQSGNAGASDMPRAYLGSRGGGASASNMDLAEFFVYDEILDATDRVQIETYVNTRYALW